MKIVIRQAEFDEAEALSALAMRSKQSNGYDDVFMQACRDELAVTSAAMLRNEYWVAVDKEIVGFTGLAHGVRDGVGVVDAFFIDSNFKRRGIGTMLWRRLVQRARSKGFKKLQLDADPFAVSFYEALGFVVTGQVPSGSIPGRTIPQMHYQLPLRR